MMDESMPLQTKDPAGALARLRAAVDEVAQVEVELLADDELAAELIELRTEINRLEAAWTDRLRRFDARTVWREEACSATAWLSRRCRMAPATAGARLRTSRRLPLLPVLADAYRAGTISTAHVGVVTRAVTDLRADDVADADPIFAEAAAQLTPDRLGLVVKRWRAFVDPDGTRDEHDKDVRRRRLHLSKVFDTLVIDGQLDPEAGETILAAVNAIIDRDRAPGDERMPEQRRADALVTMAREWLSLAPTPHQRGRRPHMGVTLDWASLSAVEGASGVDLALLDHGSTVPAETARRLACDAEVSRIITGPHGEVLDVGRRCRTVTAAQWRALAVRDGGCTFPGCTRPTWMTVAHHIIHWAHGGPSDLDNYALVCHEHHHDLHEGGWALAHDITTRTWCALGPRGTYLVADPAEDPGLERLRATARPDPPPVGRPRPPDAVLAREQRTPYRTGPPPRSDTTRPSPDRVAGPGVDVRTPGRDARRIVLHPRAP